MKHLLSSLCLLIALLSVPAKAASPQRKFEDYQWQNRVLVLASLKDGAALKRQLAAIDGQEPGLLERDLVVIQLSGEASNVLFGDKYAPTAHDLRSTLAFDEKAHFEIVLVGKDGDVKLRSITPLSIEKIFNTIDAMPMRLHEMQIQKKKTP